MARCSRRHDLDSLGGELFRTGVDRRAGLAVHPADPRRLESQPEVAVDLWKQLRPDRDLERVLAATDRHEIVRSEWLENDDVGAHEAVARRGLHPDRLRPNPEQQLTTY